MNPGPDPEQPVARGLFLCDLLIVDASTNKVSLINLFERVRAPSFPSPPRPFVVYAYLTDGFGEVDLAVEIESLDGLQQVYAHSARVRFPDRLGALHIGSRSGSARSPGPGSIRWCCTRTGTRSLRRGSTSSGRSDGDEWRT
jgi:hypothetical protein